MTNYERFREKLKKRIQEFLGPEVVIEYSDVRKNNGSHYEGLYMMGLEDQMLPILNIKDYYHYYLEQNRNMDDVMERVKNEIAYPECTDSDLVGVARPFEEIRENIHYGLINYEANRQRLKGLVYRRFLDLAVVLYYTVYKDEQPFAMVLIPKALAELWQMDSRSLFKLAEENAKKEKVMVLSVPQLLEISLTDAFNTAGDDPEEIREKVDTAIKRFEEKMESSRHLPQRMFLLTNSSHCYGAACILYPGVLYALARREKEDLYILPTSINGVLIVPAGDKTDEEFLKKRVAEMARVEQREKDWLSGKLYRYIAERDVIVEV